jgi:hypothetical protein
VLKYGASFGKYCGRKKKKKKKKNCGSCLHSFDV